MNPLAEEDVPENSQRGATENFELNADAEEYVPMIFTNETLVIPTSDSNNSFNLELKNIFSTTSAAESGGDAIRIWALLKLPKELFPDGYKNAYGEIERWFPIYRSSGINSGHAGNWHPFLGAVRHYHAGRPYRSRVNIFITAFFRFLLEMSDQVLESKDKEFIQTLIQGVIPKLCDLHLNDWIIKCSGMYIVTPTDPTYYRGDTFRKNPKFPFNIKTKEVYNILRERFKNMHKTLMSKNSLQNYTSPNPHDAEYQRGYLCNNFFTLVNDTLTNTDILEFEETPEKIQIKIVESNQIYTINNIIDHPKQDSIINNSLGKQNIFGMNLNRQSPNPDIANIINIINKYKAQFHTFLKDKGLKDMQHQKEEDRENFIKILLEVLTDVQNLQTIDEIYEKLTADPKFISTIPGVEGESKSNQGGRGKSRQRNERKTKIKKKSNKRRRKSRRKSRKHRKR